MEKVFIIHCWEGYPNYCWYPKTKKELEAKGYAVIVPEMPDTDSPKLSGWLSKIAEIIDRPDKNTYLIGHSLGCITILRYLESLRSDEKIGGVVLVAGFTDSLGFEEIKTFFEALIDFKKIKKHCSNFVAIHSDNDPYVDLKYSGIFKKKLGAKVIIKHNAKHFSGEIEGEKSCTELPDVIDSILDLSKK